MKMALASYVIPEIFKGLGEKYVFSYVLQVDINGDGIYSPYEKLSSDEF